MNDTNNQNQGNTMGTMPPVGSVAPADPTMSAPAPVSTPSVDPMAAPAASMAQTPAPVSTEPVMTPAPVSTEPAVVAPVAPVVEQPASTMPSEDMNGGQTTPPTTPAA